MTAYASNAYCGQSWYISRLIVIMLDMQATQFYECSEAEIWRE